MKDRNIDLARAARAVEELLLALGHDPATEQDLQGVGHRVARTWANELLSGERADADANLETSKIEVLPGESSVVVFRGLQTACVCPHHLMPAIGEATVVYLPTTHSAGLGAIARLVDNCARRLVIQEHVGQQVADTLVRVLGARGALCKLSMTQTCLAARGERKVQARIETVSVCGSLAQAGADRDLVIAALG